jgi:hypothetical protein
MKIPLSKKKWYTLVSIPLYFSESIPLSLTKVFHFPFCNGLIPWVERFYQERVEHNDPKDE